MGHSDGPPGLAIPGWLCVVTGGLLILTAAMFALTGAMQQALASQGVDVLAQAKMSLDPLSAWALRQFRTVSASLLGLGLATLVAGLQFLRRRPGARGALEILAWGVLVGTVLLQGAALWNWDRLQAEAGPGTGLMAGPVASTLLSLLQVVTCVLIIRFLRSEPVRSAFRQGSDGGEGRPEALPERDR